MTKIVITLEDTNSVDAAGNPGVMVIVNRISTDGNDRSPAVELAMSMLDFFRGFGNSNPVASAQDEFLNLVSNSSKTEH